MPSVRKKIVKATALLAGLQFLTHITGMLRQILIAGLFGTSVMMDGYLVASAVVGLIIIWVRLPIRQTIIPMFRHDLAQRGEQVAWANFSILFNNLVLVLIFIAGTGWLFAPYLVGLIAPGYENGTGDLATSLARITMVAIIFLGMAEVLSQIFLSYEKFFIPGIEGSVENLIVILGVLAFGSAYGIYGLAVAIVISVAAQFAIKIPILWEKRKLLSHRVDFHHPATREMGRLSIPLLISTGGSELAKITDRIFASLLPVGSLSALAYGHKLVIVPIDLFLRPLQQSTFPHFTKLSAERNFEILSRQLSRYLRVIFFLVFPAAIGIMVVPEVIVRVIYQRGAFDETSTLLTSQAFFFYSIGLPAIPICRILNRTFFSLKDTWTPTKLSLLCIGIKIILGWILLYPLSHGGIALAESVSQIIRAFFLLFLLPDQVKGEEGWNVAKSFGLTLAGSVSMAIVVYAVKERITGLFSAPWELATLVLLGLFSYGFITFVLQRQEFQTIFSALTILKPRVTPTKF
jgi:putative peptidoglycan lipid II flippase